MVLRQQDFDADLQCDRALELIDELESFANERAVRDAENRAGREVAEQLRFAISADLRRLVAESQF